MFLIAFFKMYFISPPLNFIRGGMLVIKFGNPVIEQRDSRFQGVGHGHTVFHLHQGREARHQVVIHHFVVIRSGLGMVEE